MVTLISLLTAALADPGAALVVETGPGPDFGQVVAGSRCQHRFIIRNASEGEFLTIRSVAGSCGCARIHTGRRELAPGERTPIDVTVFTAGLPDGPHRWRVSVTYDGPAGAGTLDLGMTARVVGAFRIEPTEMRLELPAANEGLPPIEREVRLAIEPGFVVAGAISSSPRIVAGPPERRGPDWVIGLRLTGGWPEGVHEEAILLRTTDPGRPEIAIPIRIEVRTARAIEVVPSRLSFTPADDGEASRLVQLRATGGGAVRIGSCECDHPSLRATWPDGSFPVGTVRVRFSAVAVSGTGEGRIRVELAEPAGETIEIPVSWRTR